MVGLTKMFLGAAAVLLLCAPAAMADTTYRIEAKGGVFSPATLEIPAGQKVTVVVKNADTEQVEFESYPLNIEQKINSGDEQTFFIGPLTAGSYPYFDDNNQDAKGTVVAR